MIAITRVAGKPHITPRLDAMWHRGIAGTESGVFEFFESFKAEISSNNKIRIRSGIGMLQGRFFAVEPSTYDEVSIGNGTQGEKRIDLIVARWTVDDENNTQNGDWYVIQGTPTTGTPAVPAHTTGDLDAGDLIADMPMFQVELNGINITAIKKVYKTWALPIVQGGTGATTAAEAREKLDLSHVGAAASAKGTGSVPLSSAVITKVPLSAWIARTDTAFTFADGGIKCPYDGVVEISGSVYINTTSSGTHGCYVTCGDYDTSQFLDTASGGAISSGRIIIPVSAGDIVYLKGRSSQTSSVEAGLSSTHLDIKYIK